jgi:hypothetical protein
VRCFGESSGSITVSGVGGTDPYSYNWSNGDSDSNAGSIPVGNYSALQLLMPTVVTNLIAYDVTQPEPIVVTIQA